MSADDDGRFPSEHSTSHVTLVTSSCSSVEEPSLFLLLLMWLRTNKKKIGQLHIFVEQSSSIDQTTRTFSSPGATIFCFSAREYPRLRYGHCQVKATFQKGDSAIRFCAMLSLVHTDGSRVRTCQYSAYVGYLWSPAVWLSLWCFDRTDISCLASHRIQKQTNEICLTTTCAGVIWNLEIPSPFVSTNV
jgi:hypothetical protein